MRVSQVSVKRLFGMFDHHIPLDRDKRITIIHGPNGYGKTTILRLLDALFNNRRAAIRNTPFELLVVVFDDASRLSLSSHSDDNNPRIEFRLDSPGKKARQFVEEQVDPRALRFPLSIIEHEIPELERVGAQLWRNLRTRQVLDLEDVFQQYRDALPPFQRLRHAPGPPDWLKELLSSVPVRLIEAQRLLRIPEDVTYPEHRKRPSWSAAVEAYSEDLAGAIKTKLAESAALSQSLDRTFPQRLVDTKAPDVLPEQELLARIVNVERHRARLINAGLLDPQREPAFQVRGQLSEHEMRVLSVWVRDVDEKLAIYDELAAKIDLLKDVINQHFLFKEMEIDKERGFLFHTPDKSVIPPTSLSSGEQHELVLVYELLFKVSRDALVLIDEPELSLHVAWQMRFLDDLEAIIRLSPFDAMIATHSPQIINERWDLTVKLSDPT